MKRPYRGVFMDGFDHILCDNFVVTLINGNVDKPIFFWITSGKLSDLQLEGVLYAVSIIVTLHRISSIMVMTRARYFSTVDKRNFR